MKSIVKKIAGIALLATFAFGIAGCTVNVKTDRKIETVATPAFSVASGEVESGTELAISCITEGAKIYYTIDGSSPIASSTEYTAAISVTEAVTIKAIAVKDGMNDSTVASVSYTIKAAPGIPAGEVAKANLTINGTEIAKTSEISVIPAGTFATIEMTDDSAWSNWVSSTNEVYKGVFLKNRKVKLSPFVMGQYPITRDLYNAVMGSDPSTVTSHETQGENPVNCVNWFDAIIFCNKLSALEGLEPVYSYNFSGTDETDPDKWISDTTNLGAVPTRSSSTNYLNWNNKVKIDITKNGYRLPTEAEWEFAARGGDPAKADWKYAFSGINVYGSNMVYGTTYLSTDSNLATVGWYTDNSSSGTHGVGLKKANALNLYDMSGNVLEWCNDFYNSTATTNDSAYTKDGYVTDPLGGASGLRCQRGGSWSSYASYCAVSYRYYYGPYYRARNNGFRVCRSIR